MRTTFKSYVTPVLACSFLLATAAGCGKKDKGDDSGPAPAVDTNVTETSVDGGSLRVKYKSTDPNAKFKCQLEAEGQAAEWQDCPADGATLAVQPGVRYVFRVKAIGANGVEDAEPYAYAFTAAGSTPTNGNLATLILNKDQVGETYDQKTLTLEFGVDGAASTEDVRYECKRENETVFRRCPSGDRYEFLDLKDGYNYGLAVRAVLRDGGTVAQEDGVSFTVEMNNISINGADQLQSKTGTAQMQFSHGNATGFACAIDQAQPSDCTQGLQVRLNQLSQGNHSLLIQALGPNNAIIATETLTFCAKTCGGEGGGPVQVMEPNFVLGAHYAVTVPTGFHVQQYSNDLNFNGALDFYRISVDSDPYAIGIDRCIGEWDMITSAMSGAGDVYDYCRSTRPHVVQNFLLEHRFANNHMQMATDPELIASGQAPHEVILFNMFPEVGESFYTESRFAKLCRNGIGGIALSPPVAFANGFFDINWLHAQFSSCVVTLAGVGPGFGQGPQVWNVGVFYIADRNQPLPCGSCSDYRGTKNLLEVVYMTNQAFNAPAFFTQAAQKLMLQRAALQSLRP